MPTEDHPAPADLAAIGDDALDRFIETFNSRDAAAWAASLSYPHVRVTPRPQTATSAATEAEYAAAVTYDAADAMGWDHSEWDTKQILATSPSKIHASAQWCRYDAAGARILPNDVSYVITDAAGRWGIQARFGVDSRPPADVEVTTRDATQTWRAWWQAIADGDESRVGAGTRFPFSVVEVGAVRDVTAPAELVALLGDLASSTTVDAVGAPQVGELGVNLSVRLTGPEGAAHHGLFLVTLQDAAAVAAASVLTTGDA